MKSTRCVCLLLSSLLVMLAGCEFREMLDEYPVNGVVIKLNWEGVTETLPDGMRAIFYPKSEEGRKADVYLSVTGGEVKVPPGRYSVVVYNYNTESVQIEGEASYETIRATTGHCTGLSTKEDMVWSPDALYVVALDDILIEKSDVAQEMELKPEVVVQSYSFDIKMAGLKNVADIVCSVTGLNGSCCLSSKVCTVSQIPIYVDVVIKDGFLWGYFSHFASLQLAESRGVLPMELTVKILKTDNTVQEVKVDITELIETPPPVSPPGGEGTVDPPGEVHIEVPVPDGEIKVDDVEPKPGGDGGIGGDVGDWGDEDNVELPV